MAGNAGGLSYSALRNSGRVTLPSVESWGTNMNILRDPPKSITTRRIDKVGQTSSITEMIDGSANRVCEAISHYARGSNPFVSVSYSNEGNNGGQNGGGYGFSNSNQGKQAFLPYTIMRDGAFRPPVLSQENLLPLSRQPRPWTTAFTKPGFADYSKGMKVCGTAAETREVRTNTLKVCARPTAVYQIETPMVEPFEVKYVIQNPLHTTATSGARTMDLTNQTVQEPTKGIDYNVLHTDAHTNLGYNKYVDANEFDPERYLQDTMHTSMSSNVSAPHLQFTSIEDILDFPEMKNKELFNISYTAPASSSERTNYIHENIELSRKLPEYNATTNLGKNIHKRSEYDNSIILERNMPLANAMTNPGTVQRGITDMVSSRDYKLAQKINPGGFDGRANLPTRDRPDMEYVFESDKMRLGKKVMNQFEGRFESSNPYAR